jgi:hypothetical protein
MSILDRIEKVRKVWGLLIAHIPAPSDVWLAKWCAGFDDDVIERALYATGKKFRNVVDAAPESAHRYATASMRHKAEEKLAQKARQTVTVPEGAAVR